MIKLIVKRILITIPVLLFISLVTFFLKEILTSNIDQSTLEQIHRPTAIVTKSLEQNTIPLPSFYFSILPSNFPDSLDHISDQRIKHRCIQILKQGVRWNNLKDYMRSEENLLTHSSDLELNRVSTILQSTDLHELNQQRTSMHDSILSNPYYRVWADQLAQLIGTKNTATLFLPTFHWHGSENLYHLWMKKIVQGNWGVSVIDHRPAWIKIKEALSWTLTLNLLALILVYLLSFLIGEYLFNFKEKRWTGWLENGLLFFYSIPRFFLAMVLILVFASDTVSKALHILPTPGFIDYDPNASLLSKWSTYGSTMILPLICMTLPLLAYNSRMYASRLNDEKLKPYAFFAWAQGADARTITRKHLRKNAILPLLTLIGMEIPALIGGSVVIEVLFNIPGMGRLMMQSIVMQDWAIVFDILLMTGMLTVIGKLITDIGMRFFDPRIV